MSEPESSRRSPAALSRWPLTMGTIGIVIGILMILDEVDDLQVALFWTAEEWRHLVGQELADFLVRSLPPRAWMVANCLVKMALGGLLVAGSLALRHRRRLGVTLCRSWAGLAIAWLALEMTWVFAWMSRHAHEIPALPPTGWQGPTTWAIALAFTLLLAWPVTLLSWLARPQARQEIASWQG